MNKKEKAGQEPSPHSTPPPLDCHEFSIAVGKKRVISEQLPSGKGNAAYKSRRFVIKNKKNRTPENKGVCETGKKMKQDKQLT